MANSLGNNGGRFYSYLNRPVLIDCNFIVDSANGNGLGIRSLKGMGVKNVFMNTSASAGSNRGYTNPNPAAGYALIELDQNYNRYCGGFAGFVAPSTGGTVAINATALTPGNPYIVASAGHGTAGAATIAPVADSSGSLASTWFSLFDSYGNIFAVYYIVNGVGAAPSVPGAILVPVALATNATAANITTALSTAINALQSGISGVSSFTTSGGGGATLTVTSSANLPLAGIPQDSAAAPTGATMALTKYKTNAQNWRNVGLPPGVNPSVGAAFIATASGDSVGGGSSGLVVAVGTANILAVQVVGDPNQSLARAPVGKSANVGGMMIVQFLSDVATVAAPTDGDVVGMAFLVEQGSILIDGE